MSHQASHQSRSCLSVAIAILSLCAGSAWAQNALGDGTALDANTGQQGRRNFERPNFAAELSFRNSVATGNAPGGVSFRGDLGYRAPGEFSGELGSDSLFAFRRDSLYSGLAGMGIRGTDALQYQFSLTTGSTPPQNLVGNMSFARDSYYNPNRYQPSTGTYNSYSSQNAQPSTSNNTIGYDIGSNQVDRTGQALSAVTDPTSSIIGLDAGSMHGVLRSSATYTTTTNLQPSLLSVYTQGIDQQSVGLIASSLLGVTSTPLGQDQQDANPLVARPSYATNTAQQDDQSNAPESRMVTSYDQMVEQMRSRVEEFRNSRDQGTSSIQTDESNDEWLLRQMQDLREKLYGTKPANEHQSEQSDQNNPQPTTEDENESKPVGAVENPGLVNLQGIQDDPNSPLNQAIQSKITGEDPDEQSYLDENAVAIDPEALAILRANADRTIDQFIDPNLAQRDVYAEHIAAGQRLLGDARYFDAEERFTHALSIKPRDIPAQLGRLHAQIGAGMVLSASVNLQTMFSVYPEIIGSKYTGQLLPSEKRIQALVLRLQERSGIIQPKHSDRQTEGPQVQVASALLLAYLGYQTDDQQIIKQGLDLVESIGTDGDQRLASLLRQVWNSSSDHD